MGTDCHLNQEVKGYKRFRSSDIHPKLNFLLDSVFGSITTIGRHCVALSMYHESGACDDAKEKCDEGLGGKGLGGDGLRGDGLGGEEYDVVELNDDDTLDKLMDSTQQNCTTSPVFGLTYQNNNQCRV